MHSKRILIISVLFGIFLFIGFSYALWQITLKQETENVITTGCFKIEFQDKNPLGLNESYPISDEEGKSLVPYEFTITSICDSYASFQINLEILNTTTLNNLDYMKIMLDNEINLLTENDETTKTLENATKSFKLKTGYLRANQTKTFSLRLWMDEDTPTREEFMNKVFESKITVIATQKENFDNNIEYNVTSQNVGFSELETLQIHVTSESYDIVSMSEDLEFWEELENKGKDIIVEKTVTKNGTYTYYFQDEAENIQDVSVTATKIDDKKPIANMSVSKTNNVISINASSSRDNETSVAKYYYSKDGKNYIKSTSKTYQFTETYAYGKATDTIVNYEKNQIKRVYLKVEDEIGNISNVKEFSITSTDFAYDETIDNNLRYIGSNPNNFVSFNNELWRIIGVMNNIDDGTGKKETRIKLIRNESIGEFSWDNKKTYGINDWSAAALMNVLNKGAYWSKTNGDCPNGPSNATISCNFSSIGLSEESKKLIGDIVWNLGANNVSTAISSQWYSYERGDSVFNNGRPIVWKGTIGLMYPSDYGYATSGGSTTNRKMCLSTDIESWNDLSDCTNNNWLFNSETLRATLTPNSSGDNNVFCLHLDGTVKGNRASNQRAIFPTLYLKKGVKIISGNGSIETPFELSLN